MAVNVFSDTGQHSLVPLLHICDFSTETPFSLSQQINTLDQWCMWPVSNIDGMILSEMLMSAA